MFNPVSDSQRRTTSLSFKLQFQVANRALYDFMPLPSCVILDVKANTLEVPYRPVLIHECPTSSQLMTMEYSSLLKILGHNGIMNFALWYIFII